MRLCRSRHVLFAVFTFAAIVNAQEVIVRTSQVLVRFDDRMQRRLEWTDAGSRSIVAGHSAPCRAPNPICRSPSRTLSSCG